jgi:hypothetical protein
MVLVLLVELLVVEVLVEEELVVEELVLVEELLVELLVVEELVVEVLVLVEVLLVELLVVEVVLAGGVRAVVLAAPLVLVERSAALVPVHAALSTAAATSSSRRRMIERGPPVRIARTVLVRGSCASAATACHYRRGFTASAGQISTM